MLGIRQCVVIVDLDGLKNLNDTAGHAAGTTCCNAQQRPWVDPPAGPTSLPDRRGRVRNPARGTGRFGTGSVRATTGGGTGGCRCRSLGRLVCQRNRRQCCRSCGTGRRADVRAKAPASRSVMMVLLKVPGSRWSWVRALDIGTCVREGTGVQLQRRYRSPTRVHKSNACGGGRRYSTVSTSLPRTSPAASRSNAERASAKGTRRRSAGADRSPHMSINRRSSAAVPIVEPITLN